MPIDSMYRTWNLALSVLDYAQEWLALSCVPTGASLTNGLPDPSQDDMRQGVRPPRWQI